MRRTWFLAALAAIAVPGLAAAQHADGGGRVRVGINGGIQAGESAIHEAFTVQKNLEGTPITADVVLKRARLADAGVVVRVKGHLGVGVAVSYATVDADADVAAEIPHPFFFSQSRRVTGAASANRTETTTHIDAVWMVPSRTVDVLVSAGPSLFNVTQTLVTDVLYSDTYPYDVASFGSASTTRVSETATGFHVGADVTLNVSAHLGVGALVRFSRASAIFVAGTGNSVTVDLGGVQAAGGLRLRF
jgi:hypothetical protein